MRSYQLNLRRKKVCSKFEGVEVLYDEVCCENEKQVEWINPLQNLWVN